MSLQALWWRSFFSSTKQLPQPPLPLWQGRDRHRTGSTGRSDQPGWGAQGSDHPRLPPAPSSRAPTVLSGVPTSPQLCTSPSPWDQLPFPGGLWANGRAQLESTKCSSALCRGEQVEER